MTEVTAKTTQADNMDAENDMSTSPLVEDIQHVTDYFTRQPYVTRDDMYLLLQLDNTSSDNTSYGPDNSTVAVTDVGRDEHLARIEVAVLATIFTLAVVGNVCVLVALGRRRKVTSRMHMFILHLSVADLLVAFCNILPQIAWDLTGTFRGGDFLCRLVTFLQVFVMYLSTYVLVMTAVDRYRAICYPLSNYNWTPRTVNLMITLVYLLSAALSIPQPLLFKYQISNNNGDYDCWANFDPPWLLQFYILSFTFLVYIAPFLVLVFAYGSICYTIWVNQPLDAQQEQEEAAAAAAATAALASAAAPAAYIKNAGDTRYVPTTPLSTTNNNVPSPRRWPPSRNSSTSSQHVNGRHWMLRPRAHSIKGFSRAKLKTVKLTFVVILGYLFCWSPFFISQIWWLYDPSQENNSAVVIMVLLSSLNSCCNPWIYLAFSGNLLRHLFPCTATPCCPPGIFRRTPFLLQTPSNSPPRRALELLGFPAAARPALADAPKNTSPGGITTTPECEARDLQGAGGRDLQRREAKGLQGCHDARGRQGGDAKCLQGCDVKGLQGDDDDSLHQPQPPPRHSFLTSLLIMRMASRNKSQVTVPAQQSASAESLPMQSRYADVWLHGGDLPSERHATFPNGGGPSLSKTGLPPDHAEVLQLLNMNRQTSPAFGHPGSVSNGHVIGRKMKIPPDLIIQALNEDAGSSCSSLGRESSSGSNPRSPHSVKRTRLHERPAQEVAEAQLKWEHNMGIRGSSAATAPSTFTFDVDMH